MKAVFYILLIGWLFRLLLLLAQHYGIFQIPGGNADAASFVRYANYLIGLPWPEMLELYNPNHAYNGYV